MDPKPKAEAKCDAEKNELLDSPKKLDLNWRHSIRQVSSLVRMFD